MPRPTFGQRPNHGRIRFHESLHDRNLRIVRRRFGGKVSLAEFDRFKLRGYHVRTLTNDLQLRTPMDRSWAWQGSGRDLGLRHDSKVESKKVNQNKISSRFSSASQCRQPDTTSFSGALTGTNVAA